MILTVFGLLLPLLGTSLGAAAVLFFPGGLGSVPGLLCGFAGGVMTAATFFSLLSPAIAQAGGLGPFAFLPPSLGFFLGILLLLLGDRALSKSRKLPMARTVFAVTLHNIPEGMAVGVAFAGWLGGKPDASLAAALALSFGIAVQNVPEGAVISLPLYASGKSKGRSLSVGILTGLPEPLFALLALPLALLVESALPLLLGMAAGGMLYVVKEELTLPSLGRGGTLAFALGFLLMMALDVSLG